MNKNLYAALRSEELKARRNRRTRLANTLRDAQRQISHTQLSLLKIYDRANRKGFKNLCATLLAAAQIPEASTNPIPCITWDEFAEVCDELATVRAQLQESEARYIRLINGENSK